MASVHPNLEDFKNISAGLFALAASATCFRLGVRLKRQGQWWWDDTLAAISLVFMAIFVAGASLLADGVTHPRRIQIFGYYLVVIGYYIPIWGARLSILFTIIRIAPWPRQRKILLCASGFFVFQWVFLMIQAFWVCEITYPAWKKVEGQICVLGEAVAISQVISTVVSDLILITSPLWIIRRSTLNPALRFRLVAAFFISVATTIAALVHSVLVIRVPGAWEAIFGAVEVAVALTVCNASVIIPFLARKVSTSETFHESDPVATIGGSGGKKRSASTMLSTLHIADMNATAGNSVRVDVTVDQEHDLDRSGVWDKKGRSSGDEDSSFEASKKPPVEV